MFVIKLRSSPRPFKAPSIKLCMYLWSLMMREGPLARGMGRPCSSIFIHRMGYSVAQSTEQSISIVELLVVDMLGVT